MDLKRVLIIGNAGSGKTTFAVKLAKKTKIPLVHLDKLYWFGNWTHRERADFDSLLQAELAKHTWIIDGNFNRTLPHRLKYCDTVFYFDIPTSACLWGITKRVFQSYGKTRFDMGGNCPEYFDKHKLPLYKNVLAFNKQHREKYNCLLSETPGIRVIRFKNRRQADSFLKSLSFFEGDEKKEAE